MARMTTLRAARRLLSPEACRVVLCTAIVTALTSAAAGAYTVRTTRPRIWLTPSLVTSLQGKATANTPRWQSLKSVCDTYINSVSQYDTSIGNYATAYVATGNPVYGDKAVALAQIEVDKGLNAILATDRHGHRARTLLPDVCIAYDWCHDRLTPTQRDRFRAQLEEWADWVWPETNPSRVGGWSVNNPGDNYYHGFMMTWIVGLTLYGDSPKAQGYLDNALRRWDDEARPYLERFAAGGYLLEGTYYGAGTAHKIFAYLAAHKTATGENLLTGNGFEWAREAMLCRLYTTLPDVKRQFPGGDQARNATAPLSEQDRAMPMVGLTHLDDPTLPGFTRFWLDRITPNKNGSRWLQWEEFLWYQEGVPSINYTQSLPTGYHASGAGWMTSRSDWGSNATYLTMQCGPTRESHGDLAQNSFTIFRTEWLAANARVKSYSGLLRETEYHNTITVGGKGQPDRRPELAALKDGVHPLHFADTEEYAYFDGEAKDAYTYWKWPSPVPILNEFRREIVHLKPNRVVVFDRVDAVNAADVKKWHLHVVNSPTISGHQYQATAANGRLFGTSLMPAGATLVSTPINQGRNGILSSYRIDIAAPTGQKRDYFLNVLETAASSQSSSTTASLVTTERATLVGARIGEQVVIFDDAPDLTTAYSVDPATGTKHWVFNRTPSALYRVREYTSGLLLADQQVRASDQGVLSFNVLGTAATARIVLERTP